MQLKINNPIFLAFLLVLVVSNAQTSMQEDLIVADDTTTNYPTATTTSRPPTICEKNARCFDINRLSKTQVAERNIH